MYAQLIGNGAVGAEPSLYVFTDKKRYIFNVPEGTQRCCLEHNVSMHSIESYFFTSYHWNAIGGWPGMLLTTTSGRPDCTLGVSGPPGLLSVIRASRHHVYRPNVTLNYLEFGEEPYNDGSLTVTPIITHPTAKLSGSVVLEPEQISQLAPRPATPIDISYICQLPDVPGKFDAKKADQLGVPKGKERGLLMKGQSVTLADGSVVAPEMCVGAVRPGPVFAILACRDAETLDAVTQHPAWAGHYAAAHVFYWLPPALAASPAVLEFASRFAKSTNHVLASHNHCPAIPLFRAAWENHIRLNAVDATLFPIGTPHAVSPAPAPLKTALPLTKFFLSPDNTKLDTSAAQSEPDTAQLQATILGMPEFKEVVTEFERVRGQLPAASRFSLAFTGTGSSSPGKYRNLTGNFLSLAKGSMLMDAGESTYYQLYRMYGTKTDEVLAGVAAIWLSHAHADHHLGVITLVQHLNRLREGPVLIIGPRSLGEWFGEYNALGFDLRFTYVDFQTANQQPSLLAPLGFVTQESVEVVHCEDAHGLVLVHEEGWKLVNSGDTRYHQPLIEAGKGATLLVHEATLEDDLAESAEEKGHSTMSEALRAGAEMKAKHILLTHFSQRYPRIPVFAADQKADNVSFSQDLLCVSEAQLGLLGALLNVLRTMFALVVKEK